MITLDQLTNIIAKGEQLDVEFKSDRRTMPDREIYEEALAARKDKRITREYVADLCKITTAQAYHLLKKMANDKELGLHGSGRGSYYTLKTHT